MPRMITRPSTDLDIASQGADNSEDTSSFASSLRAASRPAALVLVVCAVWLASVFGTGHDVRDFIHMGRRYVSTPLVGPLFKLDPDYPYAVKTNGYDGQFAYYIALAPIDARMHVDRVNYRYTRILYPMTARVLSFGFLDLIPFMLILINWLAIAAGTLIVALWLKRKHVSPWFSLVYGLSPGLFICLHRDLEEPLAYALIALGMYLYSYGGPRRLIWSGIAFALAALTRESTAVFPIVLGLWMFFAGGMQRLPFRDPARWRPVALLLGIALGPFVAYKIFLLFWLGTSTPSVPPGLYPQVIPFGGILTYWPWNVRLLEIVASVVVPALLCAGMGIWAVRKRDAPPEVWILLANVLLFVIMLNPLTYLTIIATARVTMGVVLATLLSLPAFDRRTGRNRNWLWISISLWYLPTPTLLPLFERPLYTTDPLLVVASVTLLWMMSQRRPLRLLEKW